MVVLPLVVRGVGPGGYTGLLTDLDLDLIFDDLAGYRYVLAMCRNGHRARALMLVCVVLTV